MPQSPTPTCTRCGHKEIRRGKPYAAWRIAPWRVRLLLWLFNIIVTILVPRRPRCAWCHVSRMPKAQRAQDYDPFVYYTEHTLDTMVLRRRAASVRPHASTGRWQSEDRHTVLNYLIWRDGGRCGLCAMPLPAGEGQVEHVVPKKFGYFDFSKGRASPGSTLESKLHHVDNLQAAHDYCNRAKGNRPVATNWRHPGLPPLPVAQVASGARTYLWGPER